MRCRSFALLLAVPFLFTNVASAQEPATDSAASDAEILRSAKVSSQGPELLEFLRQRTLSDANRAKVKALVGQLGDRSFKVREKATSELITLGPLGLPLLREAIKDPDQEVARRARHCLDLIQRGSSATLAAAVVRQVARRKPVEAAQALLDYLPAADDDYVADEVRVALAALALRDGQPEMALVSGLAHADPVRRAAAAEALCRAAVKDQLPAVRKLLHDPDAGARLRVALALTDAKEREAIPVLVQLLAELPQDQGWQAESMLLRLAGEQAPAVVLGATEADRQKARDAWAGWWRDHGTKVDLTRLDGIPRLLGLTLVATWDNGQVGTILEIGPEGMTADGKPRFELKGTPWPLEVQVLPANRLLLVEYYDNVITERTRKGELIWKHPLSGPLYAHRLANGNTFMVNRAQLLEVDRTGKEVFSQQRGNIEACQKLPSGRIAVVTSEGNYLLLDAAGKELKTFPVGRIHSYGVFAALPNGGVVIPQGDAGKVVEYDATGKKIWEATAQKPTAVYRLPNGHTLVACRDAQIVVELNREGKEVWRHKSAGYPWRVQRR